jgi:glycosyltransferase involved in cell wall biosynthesis
MILTVALYTFVVFAGIQIIYYLIFSSFLFKQKKRKFNTEQVPVSVIVFAKNSAAKLQENLPFILEQNYPVFEIVIINNDSIDGTLEVVDTLKKKHTNIKIVNVANNEDFWNNKKYSLTSGIKASKHDHLLFTDANSNPISAHWISEMSKNFTIKRTIFLGYEKYRNEKYFTNLLIRFENLMQAMKCFSFAKYDSPFMAFGNNLTYRKSDFFKVNGYINHIKIRPGVEDLFIRDAATKKKSSFIVSEDSFMETDAPKSFNTWFQGLRIKNSLTEHYKFKHRFLLHFFTITKGIFYLLAIVLLFFYPWETIVPLVLAYFLIQFTVIGFSAKKLKETQLIFFLPLLEISLLLIQISIFSANFISKHIHWK